MYLLKPIYKKIYSLPKNQGIIFSDINNELSKAFLTYSLSVITNRAIPNLCDGLKPIHRRIIYAMYKNGMFPSKSTKKSAKIVGETIAKYHPHGDKSVYDALVRMGQWFRSNHPIIKPQGNFGSIDGDNPAAMRYTEAKLTEYGMALLQDIEFQTIKYVPNYDNTTKEPVMLPSRLPNLLINGSDGIAVGMATKIPPHNLKEVVEAIIFLINNPNTTINDLMVFIKGPDFPTGGYIVNNDQIKKMYEKGKGSIKIQAKWSSVIKKNSNQQSIVISQIPYYVNKSELLKQLAEIIEADKVKGVEMLRDESSRNQIKIVLTLKKHIISPNYVMVKLFKHTQLQVFYHANVIVLNEKGQPREHLNIKQLLQQYIDYQCQIIQSKIKYKLGYSLYQIMIFKALKIVNDNTKEIINIFKSSDSIAETKIKLQKVFGLNHTQCDEITKMKLQSLIKNQQNKIAVELKNHNRKVVIYQKILENKANVLKELVKDLTNLKNKFALKRKSQIIQESNISEKTFIESEDCVVVMTKNNYIKIVSLEEFRLQRRAGVGKMGTEMFTEDSLKLIIYANYIDQLILFTNLGRAYSLAACDLPRLSRTHRGTHINNLLPKLQNQNEKIVAIVSYNKKRISSNPFLLILTKKNKIKKIRINHFLNINTNGKLIINLQENLDSINSVLIIDNYNKYIVATTSGKAVVSYAREIREIKSSKAIGIKAIHSKETPISLTTDERGKYLLSISRNGYGKMTLISEYRVTKRGSKGIITMKINKKTGPLFKTLGVDNSQSILISSKKNKTIHINLKDIPVISRNSMGVKLIKLEKKDWINFVATIPNTLLYSKIRYPLCIL